jgi:hypothetical protein
MARGSRNNVAFCFICFTSGGFLLQTLHGVLFIGHQQGATQMTNRPKIELMAFWLATNKMLSDRGLPEILWADAHHYWQVALDQQAEDNIARIKRQMNEFRAA